MTTALAASSNDSDWPRISSNQSEKTGHEIFTDLRQEILDNSLPWYQYSEQLQPCAVEQAKVLSSLYSLKEKPGINQPHSPVVWVQVYA